MRKTFVAIAFLSLWLAVPSPAQTGTMTGTKFEALDGNGVACVAPPRGMRTWWTFDEGSGTVAHDIAGTTDSSGTLIGAPLAVPGMVAGTYRLDGLSQYVDVPDGPEVEFGTGDLTIDAWVRTTASGVMPIVDKRSPATVGYTLFLYNGLVGFQMGDRASNGGCGIDNLTSPCTNYIAPVSPLVANDGNWHHVAVTVNRQSSAGGLLYLDGNVVLQFDPTIRPLSLDNTADLWIGRHHTNPFSPIDPYFSGEIDEVEMFDRVLSHGEVHSIFDAGSGGKCKCGPLTIAATVDQLNPSIGQTIAYTLHVCNAGVATVTNAVIDLALPAGFTAAATSQVIASLVPQACVTLPVPTVVTGAAAMGVPLTACASRNTTDLACGVTDASCIDVTVAVPATIGGIKFNDLDGDGIRDANDPPLAGWTIVITAPNGQTSTATTDAHGGYTFTVPAGVYNVAEVQQNGWVQTAPANGTYTANVAAGGTIAGLDFGNHSTECTPTPAGMRAWWPLDESAGGIAHDREGSDDAGAWIANPTPVAGKVAGALSFDGATQYVSVPDSPELNLGTGDLSIDAWIKSNGTFIQSIVDKRISASVGYAFFFVDGRLGFQMSDRVLSAYCSSNNTVSSCTNYIASPSSTLVDDGQWHHVAVTVDRDDPHGGVLYVDGAVQLVFDPTIHPLSLDNNAPLSIGLRHSTDSVPFERFFDGTIDEVELFDRALAPAEIAALYYAGSAGKCKGGTPGFIQSDYFTRGNFEVVMPAAAGLTHYWRDNDAPGFPWHVGPTFGSATYGAVSLIQSNFGRNFELVASGGGTLSHFFRDAATEIWFGPYTVGTGVRGTPSLIQSSYGTKGNFEVVVPKASGGIAHYWRDNDDPALPWHGPFVFAQSEGLVDDVTMIESNFGRNFEVVARIGDRLAHFWRDSTSPILEWHGPTYFANGVSGSPSLIQSTYGITGNFEVVAPLASGGFGHWWRDNDDPAQPWYGPYIVGSGRIDSVALIQGNFGTNFEVIARRGAKLEHYWRNGFAPLDWYGPVPVNP